MAIPKLIPFRKPGGHTTTLSYDEYIEAWETFKSKTRLSDYKQWDAFQKKFGVFIDAGGNKLKPGYQLQKPRKKPKLNRKGTKPADVRTGRMSNAEDVAFNKRSWRGDLGAYIFGGTPMKSNQYKGTTEFGEVLEAHHMFGNAELAPWFDDIIDLLQYPEDTPQYKQGVEMVEAGKEYFKNFKYKGIGDVKEAYTQFTKGRHTGGGLGKEVRHLSAHGLLGTGNPKLGDPGHRVTGPMGKSPWNDEHWLTKRVRAMPWKQDDTMVWAGPKLDRHKALGFDDSLNRWSTLGRLIEDSMPIREEAFAQIRSNPLLDSDVEKKVRQLNGSAAALDYNMSFAPGIGLDDVDRATQAVVDKGREIGQASRLARFENVENLKAFTKAGTTVGRRVAAVMPFVGAAGDVWDLTERRKEYMDKSNTGLSQRLDALQYGIAGATVGTTWYLEPVNTVLGLTNLGIDIGRTLGEEDKRRAAAATLRALGTTGMRSIRDLSKALW